MRYVAPILTFLVLTLAVFGADQAQANVSLKNGNFFIGYTDIVYPGGFEPKIERVYNSKTPYEGMFGWGWGNEYETKLVVSADGSVVVKEYGGGAENRFNPVAFKSEELDRSVGMIAEAAQKAGAIGNSQQLDAYKKKLKTDAVFRNDEWEIYVRGGKLKRRELTEGTQLTSNRFSFQYITKVKEGYVRNFDNGRVERFDDDGKLFRVSDKNNNFLEFKYGKDGKLAQTTDNFNRKIFFSWNTRGRIEKINGENSKEATYRYSEMGELIFSKDVDGNIYTYKYSLDKRHNLIEIGYTDKTSMQVAYYGIEKQENVRTVKDRDGTLTEYTYEANPADKSYLAVGIKVKGSDGQLISQSKYEYSTKIKADGEEWTYKMVTTLDGERTETVYNECCGLPLLIKRGGEETAFEYDAKGRVTKKTTPTEVTNLSYHPKVGKVTKVVRFSKMSKKETNWSQFEYDDKGNLVFAKNSDAKGVKLIYDVNGRIRSMVDQGKRRIDFKYNENSKPVEITDPALGTITVSYTNSGEIKKVESSAGRKIALQVTSAFQNLLDIIRPAGVTLTF